MHPRHPRQDRTADSSAVPQLSSSTVGKASEDVDSVMCDLENEAADWEQFAKQCTAGKFDQCFLDDKQLNDLEDENARLEYRCGILERALQEELAKCAAIHRDVPCNTVDGSLDWGQFMDEHRSIFEYFKGQFSAAQHKAFPSTANVPVVITEATKQSFGDYQFNGAMALAQQLTKEGQKLNPRAIAEQIVSQFLVDQRVVAKIEVSGPGFVNIHLNKAAVSEYVRQLYVSGLKAPKVPRKRAVVDFSSPNIAKEMHVGHLRSTIIGDCICRFLEYLGFDVVRVNHVGDWGTQFGMLICHLQDRFPNYLNEAPPLSDLQRFYKESKQRFDNDEEFKKKAHLCVVRLQSHEPDFMKAWKMICDVSRKDFDIIYKRLDIRIEEKGESFYQDRMGKVVKMMEEKGQLIEDEGRRIVFPEGLNVPMTIVKSDGSYTYETSDIAALHYRLFEEHADWILYVVDAGQGFHFQQLFQVAKQLGWYDPAKTRVEHIPFGVVLGEDRKKFKTRSGETVKLNELLDEGLKRSLAKLKEKAREDVLSVEELERAQEAVAYGCIKYADLSHNRTNDYVFSFDKMLDDRGNTAVYLLYAYTRIRSIARNANMDTEKLQQYANDPVSMMNLTDDREYKLAKMILKWNDMLLSLLDAFNLHYLCDYLYQLACTFTEFYDGCYCIQRDASGKVVNVRKDRLVLCETTANVLTVGLSILGIKTIEKM